jgi:hypothetical protein
MVRLKELIYERAFTGTRLAKDEDIEFINIIDPRVPRSLWRGRWLVPRDWGRLHRVRRLTTMVSLCVLDMSATR